MEFSIAAVVGLAVVVGLGLLAFWIWMLVDCLRNEPLEGNDRLLWALVILFTKGIGAVVYYFVRFRKRTPRKRTELAAA